MWCPRTFYSICCLFTFFCVHTFLSIDGDTLQCPQSSHLLLSMLLFRIMHAFRLIVFKFTIIAVVLTMFQAPLNCTLWRSPASPTPWGVGERWQQSPASSCRPYSARSRSGRLRRWTPDHCQRCHRRVWCPDRSLRGARASAASPRSASLRRPRGEAGVDHWCRSWSQGSHFEQEAVNKMYSQLWLSCMSFYE